MLGAGDTPDAADAALALSSLNSIMFRWASQSVDVRHEELTLDATFTFFVPPFSATAEVIAELAYQGAWDASANSPTLATGTGTKGHFYKVSTAGSTTLDGITSWVVADWAVFDGTVWLKSINPARFESAVVDLLAMEISQEFGREPSALVVKGATDGWRQIQAAYIKPQTATWDAALTRTYARPWTVGTSS